MRSGSTHYHSTNPDLACQAPPSPTHPASYNYTKLAAPILRSHLKFPAGPNFFIFDSKSSGYLLPIHVKSSSITFWHKGAYWLLSPNFISDFYWNQSDHYELGFNLSAGNGSAQMEKTLAMIKPDGLHGNHTDRIKNVILQSGFSIVKELVAKLDEDSAVSFYAEHSSKIFFSSLVKYMTSGPVLVMILEKENAIVHWRALIGPTDAAKAKITHPNSIRAMCGLDSEKNCVHGSDSPQSAQKEILFFFKEEMEEVTAKHDEL